MQKNIVGNIFFEEFETIELRNKTLLKVLENEAADAIYFGLENDKYIYIIKKGSKVSTPEEN